MASIHESSAPRPATGNRLPDDLEVRLAALSAAYEQLEARVARLEEAGPARVGLVQALAPAQEALPVEELPSPVRLIGLIGRVCLVLGGATLIRALVDAGTLPPGLGVALGLAYAVTWTLLALRAKARLDAGFHALASLLIAYPLLVESSTRLGILPPLLAAPLLLAVTLLHGAVAWRRDLPAVAWAAVLAAIGSGFTMMAARQAIEPFLGVFLVLGVGTLWLTREGRWQGLRWPTALAADLGVLILTSLVAWSGGTPEPYRHLTSGRAIAFALALTLGYLGPFAGWMLRGRRGLDAFGRVQTGLALVLGFGGALRATLASGSGAGLLGTGACLAGLGCYAAAAPFAEDRAESLAGFTYFTFLAQTFLVVGGAILLPLTAFAPICGGLGLAAMAGGLRLGRPILVLQSALFLVMGILASGVGAWTLRAFFGPAGPPTLFGTGGALTLAWLAATLALVLIRRPREADLPKLRPLVLLLGALLAAVLGALLIRAALALLPAGPPDSGSLAAVRTGVLSLLAVLLAWWGGRVPLLRLRWLVYPLLVMTALKFLLEDLAVGRPLTLFIGFMCFGATLMLAPRLLRGAAPGEAEPPRENPA